MDLSALFTAILQEKEQAERLHSASWRYAWGEPGGGEADGDGGGSGSGGGGGGGGSLVVGGGVRVGVRVVET